jgi:two-component system LytT family response regulator
MLRTIIVDDEKHCVKTLEIAISKYCPDVEIIAKCTSPIEAIQCINEKNPDLLLLDIEMPRMNAFELLEKLEKIDFEIIFTTAYDQYALDAFKVNAVDYLLKPIDEKDLIHSIKKIKERKHVSESYIEFIIEKIQKNTMGGLKRIPIPSAEGLTFVDVNEIVYCRAESNYTNIILHDHKKKIIAKTLKSFEKLLPLTHFFRPHQSYIVNLYHVEKFIRSDGGYLVMSNGHKVSISRNKKDSFLKQF